MSSRASRVRVSSSRARRLRRWLIPTVAMFALWGGAAQALATFAVGDRVWNDVNNNGLFDANEAGISGVSIALYNDANADCVPDSSFSVRSATTNGSGAYLFTGVGNARYVVQIEPSNFTGTGVLVGFRSSTGSNSTTTGPYEPGLNESNNAADNAKDHGRTTTNGSGQTVIRACQVVILGGSEPVGEGNQPPGIINPDTDSNTNNTIDLGVYKPTILGALGDRVWEDRDHDGVQDAGEPGVAGVTVRLLDLAGTTVLATQTTNASGNYLFSNLAPGNYMIEVVPPAGAQLTVEDVGDNTLDSDPNIGTLRTTEGFVTGGQTNTAIDAGIWFPLTLGNLVWRDNNNNGVVDAGEPGIGGVTVNLLNSAGTVIATTTTAATTGEYTFTNLIAGDYQVQIPASNFAAGAPLAGLTTSTGGGSEPAPDPDTNANNNDDNGTATGGLVVSAPVTLSSNTEPTTDGDGANGNLTVDFGFIPPQPGALGDRVWLDQNRNGVQDAGEPGVPGVTVQLRDATGATLLATQTTDANGNYLFTGLSAATYVIDFVKPAGYEFTLEDVGADQALDSDPAVANGRTAEGVVTAGQTNTQIDAGLYIPLVLGNLVWRDTDNDGRLDAGEPGIPGVTVELLNSAGAVAQTTTTDASGLYTFANLVPGDYSVRLAASNLLAGGPLAGLESSTGGGSEPAPDPDNNVNDDDNGTGGGGTITSGVITLASGTEPTTDGDGSSGNLTVDFGLVQRASVGDRVWLDQNGNGIQDAGEPGQPGVTVSLCDASNNVLQTATTDANGAYTFANLLPGTYKVGFTNLPAGGVLSPANQGANDAVDSDATAVVACDITVTLTSGQSNTTVDAGLYIGLTLGNLVWRDANNNGLVDAGEPGIGGVTVQLLNAAGAVIATTTTSTPAGTYQFTGLAPGAYSVRIPASNFSGPLAGLVTSTGNDPAPDPDNNTDNDDNGTLVSTNVDSQQITLASGTEPTTDGDGANGNLTVDFGFIVPATAAVGDRVWVDRNGNGVQDAGEPNQAGVVVSLCNAAGTVIATATTDVNGGYLFQNLVAGSYSVGIATLPAGSVLAPANQGGNEATDSDATAVGACNVPVTLAAGQVNRDVDFGLVFPLTLGNLVWGDPNNNGVVDGGETGIANVTVELLNGAGAQIATTTTNGSGLYTFANLMPGDYSVRIPASNFAAGAPLANTVSSFGGTAEPTPDPDNDVDNDDNGPGTTGPVTSSPVTLASGTEPAGDGDGGNGNLTVDFGFTPTPASVGDRVWHDQNGNGIQDAGEPGVPGVTVSLCNTANVVIANTVTNASGNYSFTNLAPGSYRVGFTNLPAEAVLTAANQGASDATDSDATALGACVVPVDLSPGEADTSIDAGLYFPLSLGNLVWVDADNDGVVDAGEPGLANVAVQLLNGAGTVVGTTSTSGTGLYQFTGLAPGDYSVRVPTVPAGYVSSTGNDPAPDPDGNVDNDDNGTQAGTSATTGVITLVSGAEPTTDGDGASGNQTVDLGFTPVASVGDRVWEDVNHNGVQDAGEPGVAGVTVSLCNPAGQVVATATTNATGNYLFANLTPGAYRVGFTGLPVGSALTLLNQGANDAVDSDATAAVECNVSVTLAPGENNTSVDAGVWYPLSLGNLVWRDNDNDGLVDAGEPGVQGVTVELLNQAGAPVATATTDVNGLYLFSDLATGVYSVRLPASNFTGAGVLVNWTTSTGNDPAPDPDNDADDDDNGTANAGTITSAQVSLAPGTEPTTDGDGANGNRTLDFGVVPPASIGDRVWHDQNGNGIQDAGEPGVPGVTVSLCNPAGTVVGTTVTDANGNYTFANIAPGSYQVGFTNLPTGAVLTPANAGGNDATDSDATSIGLCVVPVSIAPAQTNNTIDAGLYFPLSLGNLVWVDTDNDGIADAGESGLANVPVQLLNGAGTVVATTSTSGTGLYQFTGLAPGDYSVRVPTVPAGYVSSTGNDPAPDPDNNADNDDNGSPTGASVTTGVITLVSGAEPTTDGDGASGNQTVDLGFTPVASVGDRVWEDVNHNGVQDAGEPGVAGVTVSLCNPAGQVVATTTTNAAGAYTFANLIPGAYRVGFTGLPAGSALTLPNQGANDAVDSDATAAVECNVPVSLAPGETNTSVDAGVWYPLSLGNLVWRDNDNDGLVDAGEPGVQGVTVELLNQAGAPVATATTDVNGLYLFPNLATGVYSVRVAASNFTGAGVLVNWTTSTGNDPAPDPDNDADNDDNGTANGGAITSDQITLARGTEPTTDGDGANGNLTLDFGVVPPASIGDRVWEDVDHDGVQDPGEPGLGGVTVTLCSPQGAVLRTVTSAADGSYVFDNLAAGSYLVGFTNLPAGGALTTANAGGNDAADSDATTVAQCNIPVTVDPNQNDTTVDAGVWFPLTLGNLVFRDLDNDGVRDAGEPGIPGVVVQLIDGSGALVATVTTNPAGEYTFGGLASGDYVVRIPATNFQPGAPLDGLASSNGGSSEPATDPDDNADNDDNGSSLGAVVESAPITLARGTEPTSDGDGSNGNLTLDFGFQLPDAARASIGDTVWLDQNHNGVQDPGEPGIAGVVVNLCQAGQVIATQTTGANGQYRFTGLAPGTYQVGVTSAAAGLLVTTPNAGTSDAADSDLTAFGACSIPVTVTAGQVQDTIDIGLYTLVRLGNLVWIDANNNGVVDAGERGVQGVHMELLGPTGEEILATTQTDANGFYLFDGLQPGVYRVQVSATDFAAGGPLAGFVTSTGANGSPVGSTEPGPGPDNDTDNDDNGTVVLPPPPPPDPNNPNNGCNSGGNNSGSGNNNGNGCSNGIGIGVGFGGTPPGQRADGRVGGPDSLISGAVTVTSGGEPTTDGDDANGNLTVDFGVFNPATIGDRVWNDQNRNGVQDAGEPGVGGVTVTLLQNGTPLSVATTSPTGAYLFTNVAPGTYTVQFSNLPAGATFVPAGQGGNPATDSDANPTNGISAPITVSAGNQILTVDAGLIVPGSIGDKVWRDVNANGLQDAGEPGVSGITVTLYDAAGTPVAATVTNADGNYLFTGLAPGTYTVGLSGLPADLVVTGINRGDDALDSDVDPASLRTGPIVPAGGEQNLTIDAGLVVRATIIGGDATPTQLQIRKRPNKPVVRQNTNVVFTIVVRNIGTVAATNVKVCDKPPKGLRFVSARGAKLESGRWCWTIASLAPGQTRTFRITLRAVATGTRLNVAWALADNASMVTTRAGVRIITRSGGTRVPSVTGEIR